VRFSIFILGVCLSAGSVFAKSGSTIVKDGRSYIDLTLGTPTDSDSRDKAKNRQQRLLDAALGGIVISSPEIGGGDHDHDHDHEGEGGHDHEHGAGDGTAGKGKTGGAGNSAGGSSAGAGGKPKIGYDPKNEKSMESGKVGERDKAPEAAAHGGKGGTPPSAGDPLPLWEPVCFLVDPAIDAAKANERIQYIIKSYAKCGVAVKPEPFTVPDIPKEPDEAIRLAGQVCPLNSHYGVQYSSVQAMVQWDGFSDKMCDSKPKKDAKGDPLPGDTSPHYADTSKRVSGCAQVDVRGGSTLTNDQKKKIEQNLRTNGGGKSHFGGFKTGDGPAFSAVDPEGDGITAAHELGHNHSMENYVPTRKGSGMGLQGINADLGEKGPDGEFNDDGCKFIKAGANKNTKGFIVPPEVKDWYKEMLASPYRMQNGRSFFDPPIDVNAPPASPPGTQIAGTTPPGGAPAGADKPIDPGPGGGHKKPVVATPASAQVASVRTGTSARTSNAINVANPIKVAAGDGKPGAVDKYGYDEKGKPKPSLSESSGQVVRVDSAGRSTDYGPLGSGLTAGIAGGRSGQGGGGGDAVASAGNGTNGDGGAGTGGAGGNTGRTPASLLPEARSLASSLDGNFNPKLEGAPEKRLRVRGDTLRNSPASPYSSQTSRAAAKRR